MINKLWANKLSLGPSDAIWWQKTGSTLAQVMACCLTAPSHYLNQCWLIMNKVKWHSFEGNFTADISAINHCNWLEKYSPKISLKSPRPQWVKIRCRGIFYIAQHPGPWSMGVTIPSADTGSSQAACGHDIYLSSWRPVFVHKLQPPRQRLIAAKYTEIGIMGYMTILFIFHPTLSLPKKSKMF